ncbi:MAG: hypothetical protein MNPFHGCM_01777 [Gemmatimonadaceae bacterium]|nr:hypothetical protein [Gemmatimonadaceae bacterium]
MVRPQRQILGHPFHEPTRRLHLLQCLQSATRLATGKNVVLERVHQFVCQHVLERLVIAGKRKENPVAQRFRDAANAFAKVSGHVVLAEIPTRPIQNQRFLLAELMVQHARQTRIRALGHSRGIHHRDLLLWIVVNQEVVRLEDLPLEVVELHLVLTEVLLSRDRRGQQRGREQRGNSSRPRHACTPPCVSATGVASPQSRSS